VTAIHCPKSDHELELHVTEVCPIKFVQSKKGCVIVEISNTGDTKIKVGKLTHEILDPNKKLLTSIEKPLSMGRFQSRHLKRKHRQSKKRHITTPAFSD
jgi:hypothetical protein